jgi:hypothetical protein
LDPLKYACEILPQPMIPTLILLLFFAMIFLPVLCVVGGYSSETLEIHYASGTLALLFLCDIVGVR